MCGCRILVSAAALPVMMIRAILINCEEKELKLTTQPKNTFIKWNFFVFLFISLFFI
jgi:hypothetical protein